MRALAIVLLLGLAASARAWDDCKKECFKHQDELCHEIREELCVEEIEELCGSPPSGGLGYYPAVTAKSLDGKTFYPIGKLTKSYPDISCPSGYVKATSDNLIEVARNIVDNVFIQLVAPTLKKTDPYWCKTYVYPDDYNKVVGSIRGGGASLSVTSVPKHYSITGCFVDKMAKGKTYTGYGQGILNYVCKEDPAKKVKQVAIKKGKGTFVAQ